MKCVIISVFVIGSVVSLSSCATRNAAQSANVPVYHAAAAPVYDPPPSMTPVGSVSVSWPLVFSSVAITYTIF